MSAMLPGAGLTMAAGSHRAITGSVKTPKNAVKTSSTVTSDCLKYFSTRYLSKWVEIAHRTGPENAKTSQDIDTISDQSGPADCESRKTRSAPSHDENLTPVATPASRGGPYETPAGTQFCLSRQ